MASPPPYRASLSIRPPHGTDHELRFKVVGSLVEIELQKAGQDTFVQLGTISFEKLRQEMEQLIKDHDEGEQRRKS